MCKLDSLFLLTVVKKMSLRKFLSSATMRKGLSARDSSSRDQDILVKKNNLLQLSIINDLMKTDPVLAYIKLSKFDTNTKDYVNNYVKEQVLKAKMAVTRESNNQFNWSDMTKKMLLIMGYPRF